MAKYYAYCEKHGIIGSKFSEPKKAKQELNKHLLDKSPPHGKVKIIEEYTTEKYGQLLARVRIYKSYY